MVRVLNHLTRYINTIPIIRYYRTNDRNKEMTKIYSIGTGKILPAEKNPSVHVKYNLFNTKFNILLTEGEVFIPFNCTIVSIAADFSSFVFSTREDEIYAIYLGKCSKHIVKDSHFLNLYEGRKLNVNDKLFTLDINASYSAGALPILAFCVVGDYNHEKIYYGRTKACEKLVFVYY